MGEMVDPEFLRTDNSDNYKLVPGFKVLMAAGVYNFIFIGTDIRVYIP